NLDPEKIRIQTLPDPDYDISLTIDLFPISKKALRKYIKDRVSNRVPKKFAGKRTSLSGNSRKPLGRRSK
ncbi:Hypothetical protein FKW44_001375, partial [Caligus rogercresseyi]